MRYKAMVVVGKRTWGGPLKVTDRMFGIFDHTTGEWWKGHEGVMVTYKYYDSAVKRATQLNEGTYVSKYVRKDSGITTYARLIDPENQPSSHWFVLPNKIELKSVRPRGAGNDVPKNDYMEDEAYEFVAGFYKGLWLGAPLPVNGPFYERSVASTKKGWALEIKVSRFEDGREAIDWEDQYDMADWIEEREWLHRKLKGSRDSMMMDVTDREKGHYPTWEPEPNKPADTWEYEVVYGGNNE